MSINKRIKHIRKICGWNQTEFASKIGLTQSGVSYMEREGSTVSEQTIKMICMAVPGLNEEWLRNEIEPMFVSNDAVTLEKFVKDHGGTDLELEIMEAYFDLPPEIRQAVLAYFKSIFGKIQSSAVKDEPPKKSVEELEEEYKKSISNFAQKIDFSASNTTNDIKTDEKHA